MLAALNDFLWGQLLIVVLIATGIFFTVGSRFVQFRYFGTMFSVLRGAMHHEKGHISSFQALVVSVAGRVGSGNIAGVKRGLFSNEAGLGSAPNVAAVAYVPHPVNQGIVQAFSVFIDTIVMCTCTATIILLSDVYQPGVEGISGVTLTQNALASHVGAWRD